MKYPIQIVAKQTGLTPATIRAWEKRYAAIVPDRTDTGRRLYSEDLLAKLQLLARLVGEGYRISDIANLDLQELSGLERKLSPPESSHVESEFTQTVKAAAAAVTRMDVPELNRLLESAVAYHGHLELADNLVFPLISMVEASEVTRPVHRSMLYATLSAFLSAQLPPLRDVPEERLVAVAAPRGSRGMLGAIASMSHVVAAGSYPLLLGQELTGPDITIALRDSGASTLLLSIVSEELNLELRETLITVAEAPGASRHLMFGGKMPESVIHEIESLGFRYLHSMSSLRKELLTSAV